ncbi:hypothetical protein [Xanthomonas arboricola]|uniref:hypothetical protein n=1 Tax=Xanthomonas arboricola TaxID=56448 RepID=UPI0013DFAACF|nr:hypothetical protein [Xanthomonas arboricola]CAG2086451.1 hypothetical protein XCY_001163 [Xanthomonas arboricola pv. juglandis]
MPDRAQARSYGSQIAFQNGQSPTRSTNPARSGLAMKIASHKAQIVFPTILACRWHRIAVSEEALA